MLSDPGCAGLLLVRGTPKKRGVVLEEVTLRIAELSDVEAVRLMVEEVHIHGDRPHRGACSIEGERNRLERSGFGSGTGTL